MCLAVPMEVIERSEEDATAALRGVHRSVSLVLCPEVAVGDYVLVHAGYAISVMDAEEAQRTLELLDEVREAEAQQ